MSLSDQVSSSNDTLEQLAVAFEVVQGVSTVVIAVVSFVWSRHARRAQRIEAMRDLLRDACREVLLEFALDLFIGRRFVDQSGVAHELSEGDFAQILSTTVLFPPTAWHRACRSRTLLFLESLRPCAHIIGRGDADFAMQDGIDPIVSRLRLALKALADFWSPQVRLRTPALHCLTCDLPIALSDETCTCVPVFGSPWRGCSQGRLHSPCTDEHRKFLAAAFADGHSEEWVLLSRTLQRLGLAGLGRTVEEVVIELFDAADLGGGEFAIIFVVLIARVPNFIYTRYIIYLQPVMAAVILLDFSIITQSYTSKYSINKLLPAGVFAVFLIFHINFNSDTLSGRITELKEPYKGPLDYTIPFIQEKYENTETLVIAANYEETSYMYYLNSKVIVGFVGNNLAEDKQADPDIVCYRSSWGRLADVFNGYFKKSRYLTQTFEVYDSPVNNIPELNFMPAFNHKFKTEIAKSGDKAAKIYFKPAPK